MEAISLNIAQGLFVKILALTYFCAFFSLAQQVKGLFGANGIMPIQDYVAHMRAKMGSSLFVYLPTLFLYRSDDRTLQWTANGGAVVALLALVGFVPSLCFAVLFLLYLSFLKVGAPFLQFQWDTLLLEVGFAGIFFAMMTPPPLVLVLWMWVLLFRFIFASGLVKWMSGCPEWHGLKAMRYHFETQPLPNIGGFFAHHLLMPFSRIVCFWVFFFEVAVPFLYFGTPTMRLWGALLSIFLQGMIIITGNYAFFNLLTLGLCVTLIEDPFLAWVPAWITHFQAFSPHTLLSIALNIVGAVMIFVNVLLLLEQLTRIQAFKKTLAWGAHFAFFSHYGLFAVMTTVREEIVIEGSHDGVTWKEYEFKYKPQSLKQRPRQIAPLQPRLDWQMWFAALSSYHYEWWFQRFIFCLLHNSQDVLHLLQHNPFPDTPAKLIRAHRYRYHFSSLEEWKASGNYWTRTYEGIYMPIVQAHN